MGCRGMGVVARMGLPGGYAFGDYMKVGLPLLLLTLLVTVALVAVIYPV